MSRSWPALLAALIAPLSTGQVSTSLTSTIAANISSAAAEGPATVSTTRDPNLPPAPASPSDACDVARVRSAGLSYWYSVWAKYKCAGVFQEAATGVVVSDAEGFPGYCELRLFRPFGDLKLRLLGYSWKTLVSDPTAVPGTVSAAWARSPDSHTSQGWQAVNSSVCFLSGNVGSGPAITPVSPDAVQFAFDAISAARQRATQNGFICGQGTLSLVSTSGILGQTRLAAARVEWEFYIEVAEAGNGATASIVLVRARVAEAMQLSAQNGSVQSAYSFLGSSPPACEISSKAPFAAFGCPAQVTPSGRRLSTQIDSGIIRGKEASSISNLQSASNSNESNRRIGHRPNMTDGHRFKMQRGHGFADAEPRDNVKSRRLGGTELPAAWDFREQQPRCAWEPRASGDGCSANSWAWAAVGAFEKQLCWLSQGRISLRLSVQRILDCMPPSTGCGNGGSSLFEAHAAMLGSDAVVPEECSPVGFSLLSSSALGQLGEQRATCPPRGNCPSGLHDGPHFSARFPSAAEKAMLVPLLGSSEPGIAATALRSGEKAMQVGLLLYGALAASIAAYPEILFYTQGVLVEPRNTSEDARFGTLAVQIVGWGTVSASGVNYWTLENSWGPNWGENQDFEQCSMQLCKGQLCPEVGNSDSSCVDSPLWRDSTNQGCAWYAANDPACAVQVNEGQLQHCQRTCKTCPPGQRRPGEKCGYFRILRGMNHLGIEASAGHAFAAGWAPPDELLDDLAEICADDPTWYSVHDPGCMKFQDYGQRSYCRDACGLCPKRAWVPPASQKQAASQSAAALQGCIQITLVAMVLPMLN